MKKPFIFSVLWILLEIAFIAWLFYVFKYFKSELDVILYQ